MTDRFEIADPAGAVGVNLIMDRPTVIEFTVPADATPRPEGELFRAMGWYLTDVAQEQFDIEAVVVRYHINADGLKLLVGTLYTRLPQPWLEDQADET